MHTLTTYTLTHAREEKWREEEEPKTTTTTTTNKKSYSLSWQIEQKKTNKLRGEILKQMLRKVLHLHHALDV